MPTHLKIEGISESNLRKLRAELAKMKAQGKQGILLVIFVSLEGMLGRGLSSRQINRSAQVP